MVFQIQLKASEENQGSSERYGLAVDPAFKVADISCWSPTTQNGNTYRGADILSLTLNLQAIDPSEIDELMANHESPCQRREVHYFDYTH